MNMIIRVEKKIAKAIGAPVIICGNSGYTITFELDAEWHDKVEKTARFVWASATGVMKYKDQKFSGDTVEVPILVNIERVYVGLFAGELTTTTSATINCKKSILCQSAKEGGDPIINGDSAFIRYSAYADGTDFTETWDNSKRYIGIATGQFAPIDKSGYVWSVFASGLSAYELAVAQGFEGSEAEWLESLRGPTGAKIVSVELIGQDDNGGNIYRQTFDNGQVYEFTAPRGEKGADGKDGAPGKDGEPGQDGITPTLQDWLGTNPIGSETHYIYYDGEKFVERPVSVQDETTDWGQIAAMSKQISSGEKTPEELGLAVGQERTITLTTGEEVTLQILGFNHDELADGSGEKAGITFGMKNLLTTKYSYHSANLAVTWAVSQLRIETMQLLCSTLPDDLKPLIKSVTKYTSASVISSGGGEISTSERLFLLGYQEVGEVAEHTTKNKCYEYWNGKTKVARTKYLSNGNGAISEWLLRDKVSGGCVTIDVNGNALVTAGSNNNLNIPYAICFGFCV